jgi:hypothetical protein
MDAVMDTIAFALASAPGIKSAERLSASECLVTTDAGNVYRVTLADETGA